MALQHWLGRSRPGPQIENPEPFKLYVVGPPVPSDDNQIFLMLVYAEIERRWNKTLPFDIEPPNPNESHGGNTYQARCFEVLKWIHAEGDIAMLVILQES
jgi:hypothetical protein